MATKAEPKKTGRPSKQTQALVDEICARLSMGEPLAQICRDAHMPHDSTVRQWGKADETVSLAIACAREDGFDSIAADCLKIADDSTNDYVEKLAGQGDEQAIKTMLNAEHVQRSKLRIETRLKLLAKWDPKRYGERMQTELSGELTVRTLAQELAELNDTRSNGH